MNDNKELEGLGRRQGALWARETIRSVIANGDELPPGHEAYRTAAYDKAMADLAACGVDVVGRAIFTKAADDEAARRYELALRAMTI